MQEGNNGAWLINRGLHFDLIGLYCWKWDHICDYGSHYYMLSKLPFAFRCFLALPEDSEVHQSTLKLIEKLELKEVQPE